MWKLTLFRDLLNSMSRFKSASNESIFISYYPPFVRIFIPRTGTTQQQFQSICDIVYYYSHANEAISVSWQKQICICWRRWHTPYFLLSWVLYFSNPLPHRNFISVHTSLCCSPHSKHKTCNSMPWQSIKQVSLKISLHLILLRSHKYLHPFFHDACVYCMGSIPSSLTHLL